MGSIAKWDSESQSADNDCSEYSENVHPKESEEPTNVTFKGKTRSFVNAVIKAKEILKKGATKELDDTKAKVMDVKNKSISTEIVIEATDKKGRGNATVEIFGPNNKSKQCSVVIKKLKNHKDRYVNVVAQKVLKPLLNFLILNPGDSNDDDTDDNNKPNIKTDPKEERMEVEDLNNKDCSIETKSSKRKRPLVNYSESIESMDVEDEIKESVSDVSESNNKKENKKSVTKKQCIKGSPEGETEVLRAEKRKSNSKTEAKENFSYVDNVKEIPEKYKSSFKKDEIIYTVPGNGCCGPNSIAAYIYGDEIYGPCLRQSLNQFIVKNFDKRYKFLTSYTPKSPFVRRVGLSGEVKFTNSDDLLSYLKTEEAKYMWTDSEDLSIIADMLKVKIKIFTVGRDDGRVTENEIHPEIEDKETVLEEVVLYHEEDNHFNLVVTKDSDLAKYGSLSRRLANGIPIVLSNNIKQTKEQDNTENVNEKEYKNCINELKNKVEEVEKYKTKIDDMEKIVNLKRILVKENSEKETQFEEKDSQYEKPKVMYQPKEKGKEFNCDDCDFQGTAIWQLIKHRNLKHCHEENKEGVKCNMCGKQYFEKSDLMKHRKQEHHNYVGVCRKYMENACPFSESFCWWRHSKETVNRNSQKKDGNNCCSDCGKETASLGELMRHRKEEHTSSVAMCRNHLKGQCKFINAYCWYNHEDPMGSVFQNAPSDKDPPNQKQKNLNF